MKRIYFTMTPSSDTPTMDDWEELNLKSENKIQVSNTSTNYFLPDEAQVVAITENFLIIRGTVNYGKSEIELNINFEVMKNNYLLILEIADSELRRVIEIIEDNNFHLEKILSM